MQNRTEENSKGFTRACSSHCILGKSATYEELLKKAGLTTLYNQRLQVMMYKVKHKLLPSYVVNIFDENETSYQLRNENDFKIPSFQSKISGTIFVV